MSKESKAREYAYSIAELDKQWGYQINKEQTSIIMSSFEAGWNEALRQIIVDANKELPEYGEDVWVINSMGEQFFCHRSNDPNVKVDKYGWCNYWHSDIVAWIRNKTFDEILMMNKDILKRLKDK